MKYSEDIKLEIGGKFINGDYYKNLKLLTKDLDKLIKSAKSEQLLIQRVSQQRELLKSFADWLQGEVWDDKHDDFSDYVEDYIKTL